MSFNRSSVSAWKSRPGKVRFTDVFIGQNQLDIAKGQRIRGKSKKDGKPAVCETKTGLEWNPLEDAAILGMRANFRSYREISKVLREKDEEQIRDRHAELLESVPAERLALRTEDVERLAEQALKDKANMEELKAAKAAHVEKELVLEDKIANTEEALKDIKETETAIAANAEAAVDGEIHKIGGKPVIYVDSSEDGLNTSELSMLYCMNARFEEKKWIAMAARFYDKTGKRVGVDILKEHLKNA